MCRSKSQQSTLLVERYLSLLFLLSESEGVLCKTTKLDNDFSEHKFHNTRLTKEMKVCMP